MESKEITVSQSIIPEGWRMESVKTAFSICNSFRYPISEEERQKIKGEFPYYGPTKIQDYINEFRLNGKYCLIGEDGDHFLKWKDLPMTLLVEGKFNVNNHAHIIQGDENLTEWFYYYFHHRELTPYLTRQGAGRYKLTKDALGRMQCLIPPIEEQKAIIKILKLIDKAIQLNSEITKQIEVKKKTLTHLLFTEKKRIKGFEDPWDESILLSRANISTGKVDVNSGKSDGKYPFYTCAKEITYSDNYSFDEEAILISGNGVGVGYCHYFKGKFEAYQRTYVLRSFKDVNVQYLMFYLRFGLRRAILAQKQDGAMPYIRLSTLQNFKIPLPSLNEQLAIAEILQCIDKQIALLRAKTETLNQQKKGLMQVLLTGKKRLKIGDLNTVENGL